MSVEPQKRAQIPLRMPHDLRHAVQVYADGHGMSVNAALVHLIDRGIALEIAYHRGTNMIKGEDEYEDGDSSSTSTI